MLLRELGMLSARYAEEEGLIKKQGLPLNATAPQMTTPIAIPVPVPMTLGRPDLSAVAAAAAAAAAACSKSSTIVSAPVPTINPTGSVQNTPVKVRSPALSTGSSVSLPESPIVNNSPLCSSTDCSVPAVLPFLAPRAPFPAANKLQQLGLSFMPMAPTFNPSQGILLQTPVGLTQLSAVPAAMLATAPHYVAAPQVEAGVPSSVASARMRKPFHKRRPAHMDKSMLICHFCGRRDTPEWRKGPGGPATLCNACGLQWAKKMRAQRHSASSSSKPSSAATSTATPASSAAAVSESVRNETKASSVSDETSSKSSTSKPEDEKSI